MDLTNLTFNWWIDTPAGWLTILGIVLGVATIPAIISYLRGEKRNPVATTTKPYLPPSPSPPTVTIPNPTPIAVQVSARILRFPPYCACCAEPTQGSYDFVATRVTGKRIIRTTSKSWAFPYCSRCVAHAQHWPNWTGCLEAFATLFIGGLVWIVLVVLFPKSAALSTFIGFIATICLGVLIIGGGMARAQTQREKAVSMCGPTCAAPFWAVNYEGWSGSVHQIQLYSERYAVYFAGANRTKLVGVSQALQAAAERVEAPETPDTSSDSTTSTPSQAEMRAYEDCITKLETAKGPGTRQAAVDAALRVIRDPDLMHRLLRAASKTEVQAVLDKVDQLKTPAARRRHIEAAIERLKSDQLDDEIQAEELAMLEKALADTE